MNVPKLDWRAIAIAALIGGAGGGGTYLGASTSEERIRAVVETTPIVVQLEHERKANHELLSALTEKVDKIIRRQDRLICEFQSQRGERCDLSGVD